MGIAKCSVVVMIVALGLGSATLWFVRDYTRWDIAPPSPEVETLVNVVSSTSGDDVQSPVFSWNAGDDLDEQDFQDDTKSAGVPVVIPAPDRTPVVRERDVSQGAVPALTREALLGLVAAEDWDALRTHQQALIDGGNASIGILEELLQAGIWRAEQWAIWILTQIATPEARLVGMGHLLTRPQAGGRAWQRLAWTLGGALDGNMVDVLVGMMGSTEGNARRRVSYLLQHARGEDALFRLFMVGEEHEDPEIRRLAMNAVFRSGRRGGAELLQDIMLSNQDPDLAARAAVGLAHSGSGDALQFLAQTGRGQGQEAELARWAIEQVRHPRSHHLLASIAQNADYDTEVRLSAVLALGNSRQRRTTALLKQVANEADVREVREVAAGFVADRTN